MARLTAFYAHQNDTKDMAACKIVRVLGGELVGSGVFLPTNERDLEFSFPTLEAMQAGASELQAAGFRLRAHLTPKD